MQEWRQGFREKGREPWSHEGRDGGALGGGFRLPTTLLGSTSLALSALCASGFERLVGRLDLRGLRGWERGR